MNYEYDILVTGGSGLVGKHLKDIMPDAIYLSSKHGDLRNREEVYSIFSDYCPKTVIHLAAKVGGIKANIENPIAFYEDNILMNTNVVQASLDFECENFIGMLSTCIYPDCVYSTDYKQPFYPLVEEDLEMGPPADSNYGYGVAKRSMYSHVKLCREKLGLNYSCLIPCNLYGKYDDFDLETCHFVPALIKRIINAKQSGEKKITLWGTGTPIRQFMYAGDLAKFIKVCVSQGIYQDLNIATPEIKTIKGIAEIAIKACDADLEIEFDNTKLDGQYRKDVSSSKLEKIYPDMFYTSLEDGIKKVYEYLTY